MKAIEFVKYFNLIKPSFDEVMESTSSVSPDIAKSVFGWYDLRITSMRFYDDDIYDVLENTNVSELPFSSIQLSKAISNNGMVKVGNIEEKGDLYFDETSDKIVFEEMYQDMYRESNYFIDQANFLSFFLKYLELDFAKVFNRNPALKFTKEIPLSIDDVKRVTPFKDLLSEIGHSFNEL